MNSWNQSQNMTPQFNPYSFPNVQARALPVYRADPIHGENAAWQFPMGPNSEIYLPDNDRDIIWWIKTDQSGNKSVMPFDVKPHQEPAPVDMNSLAEKLDAALARLDSMEEKVNAKFNKSNAKRSVDQPTAD